MADIVQAAKWIDEGKRVRRPHHDRKLSLGYERDIRLWIVVYWKKQVRRKLGTEAPFNTADLLADDWEIAQ